MPVKKSIATKRPDITKSPGVCGGVACIRGTRIPVWVLHRAKQLGASDARLLQMYPQLKKRDLVAARRYVRLHEEEIDRQVQVNEEA